MITDLNREVFYANRGKNFTATFIGRPNGVSHQIEGIINYNTSQDTITLTFNRLEMNDLVSGWRLGNGNYSYNRSNYRYGWNINNNEDIEALSNMVISDMVIPKKVDTIIIY